MRRMSATLCCLAILGAACSSGGGTASAPATPASATAPRVTTAAAIATGGEAARLMLLTYLDTRAILDRALSRAGGHLVSKARLTRLRRADAAAAAAAVTTLRARPPSAGAPTDVGAAYDAFLRLSTRLETWSGTIARPATDAAVAAQECDLRWWRRQERDLTRLRIAADGTMSVMATLHDLPYRTQADIPDDSVWVARQVSCYNASENYVTPLLVAAAKTRYAPSAATAGLCAKEVGYLTRLAADMRGHRPTDAVARQATSALATLVAVDHGVFAALEHGWLYGSSASDHATVTGAAAREKRPLAQLKRALVKLEIDSA